MEVVCDVNASPGENRNTCVGVGSKAAKSEPYRPPQSGKTKHLRDRPEQLRALHN